MARDNQMSMAGMSDTNNNNADTLTEQDRENMRKRIGIMTKKPKQKKAM